MKNVLYLMAMMFGFVACSSSADPSKNQPDGSVDVGCTLTGQYSVHYAIKVMTPSCQTFNDTTLSLRDVSYDAGTCAVDGQPTRIDTASCSVVYDCSYDSAYMDTQGQVVIFGDEMIPISGTVTFTHGGATGTGDLVASPTDHQSGCTWTVTYTKQ